ncbi:hypothetical protein E4U17_001994 [Claviceps sp. LM77 group G4]|nr:hypothetical protein E4U17_001994 [Claviceps sp. LM77 group G4]KAG6042598.1 hypothetical protein E4U33_001876 [Claviceps sp. LM78 group G4]KAG6063076.1 hypothetical protein E4U16_001011 [Claviceps sp. LM84 group G4]
MEQQRQILPAPEPLTSRSGLETWLASMRAKFAIDGFAIGLPKAQFFYVYSRLGAFQTTFLPYVTKTTDYTHQPDAFLTYISDTLGESHKERRAGLNLVKMRQGQHESLTMYVSRWEYTLFEAGSNHFSDHVRIILLSAGLRNEYKTRLDREDWPAAYADFTTLLRGFDGVFSSTAAPLQVEPQQSDGDPMDISVLRAAGARRRRCFNCNEIGHFQRDCPKSKRGENSVGVSSLGLGAASEKEEEFDWGE